MAECETQNPGLCVAYTLKFLQVKTSVLCNVYLERLGLSPLTVLVSCLVSWQAHSWWYRAAKIAVLQQAGASGL